MSNNTDPNAVQIRVSKEPFSLETSLKIYKIRILTSSNGEEKSAKEKSAEEKMAIEALVSDMKKKRKANDVVSIDGTTVLLFDDSSIQGATVDVKVYDGQDRPDGIETYHRIVDRTTTKPTVRWARVERIQLEQETEGSAVEHENAESALTRKIEGEEKFVEAIEEFEAEPEEETPESPAKLPDLKPGFRRLSVSLECREIGAKYGQDILPGLVTGSKHGDAVALTVVRALLSRNYSKSHGKANMVRDSLFSNASNTTATIQGVEVRFGVNQTLHLSGAEKVVMSEKDTYQLFFPASSLASFMDTHFRDQATAPSVENKEHLKKFFQGLQIKTFGGSLTATKTIVDFSHLTPDLQLIPAGDAQVTLSSVYQQDSKVLKFSDLPSVNVGSKARPFYVPAEACVILPNQPFRNPLSPAFQRELEEVKRPRDQAMTASKSSRMTNTDLSSVPTFHTPVGRNWQASSMREPNVLFVEAGRDFGDGEGQKRFTQPAWIAFQNTFRNMSQLKFKADAGTDGRSVAKVVAKVMCLNYPADGSRVGEWISKLKGAVDDSGARMTNFVVVFGVQDDVDRPEIFKQMKSVCNHDLGVQSIGVNLATLRKKLSSDPSEGLVRYSGQVFRKMFARTPTDCKLTGSDDVAVGIDVTQLSSGKDGKGQVLITMTLRGVSAKTYGTKVEVVGSAESEKSLPLLFSDLLTSCGVTDKTTLGNLIVFRSGCTLPSDAANSSKDGDRNLESMQVLARELKTLSEGVKAVAVFGLRVEDDDLIDLSMARADIANNVETYRLSHDKNDQRASKGVYFVENGQKVTGSSQQYIIHLHNAATNTAKPVKLTLIETGDVSQEKVSQSPMHSPQNSPTPLTRPKGSPAGSQLSGFPSTPADKAQRIPSSELRSSAGRSQFSPRSMIEERRKLSEERKPSAGRLVSQEHKPVFDSPDNRYNFSEMPNPMTPEAPSTTRAAPANTAAPTTSDFMDLIGRDNMTKLFFDNHVGIHESKWPVPTFLAKRAAGWATSHMIKNETTDGADTIRAYSLPELHENRRKMLWYL